MKKKKISGLTLRKRTVSSLEAANLSGGTGTYDCYTFAPPCVSATEPPEDETFFCPPNPTTGTNPPPPPNPTNITCGFSCIPTDCGTSNPR
ncbi:hypothetical protein [uncultured Kordia sp.]|uniref:hypothetical protein n=1 Tax=uncultured Kordia sp. TaxID=507699 RepID=UPI002638919C|nr:hypothetical protein [uncultured Kordia sp.]